MSTLKTNNVQVGQSGTATNNFTLYQPSTPDGTVRLAVGNSGATTADVITATSAGNVGVGTSSPAARFEVRTTDGAQARFRTTSGSNQPVLEISSSDSAGIVGFSTGGNATFPALTFSNGGSERMRIASDGSVGVGTASPIYKLDVSFNSASSPIARFQNTASHEASVRYTTAHSAASDYKVGVSITVADAFEIYSVAAGVARAMVDSSGNFRFNSGYGSATTAYGCRAWVNFSGTSGSIRASGNVSSVTRTGTGVYQVNFTNAMPDTNYAPCGIARNGGGARFIAIRDGVALATGSVTFQTYTGAGLNDADDVFVIIHR